MFKVEHKKAVIFPAIAAILAIVSLGLSCDRYLWQAKEDTLYVDEFVLMFLVGGVIFTLHLIVMPLFDEEYPKLGFIFAIIEGIIIFIIPGALLLAHAEKHLKITTKVPFSGTKTVYADDYNFIVPAGGLAIGAAVVFIVELVIYFVKKEWLE